MKRYKLITGFTDKKDGDMRKQVNQKKFIEKNNFGPLKINFVKQVHKNSIYRINSDRVTLANTCDGQILKIDSNFQNFILFVYTADCIPILLYDLKNNIISTVHAGWQGISRGIVKSAIDAFLDYGSELNDIMVEIGPHIEACCYHVDKTRADLFKSLYGDKSILFKDNKYYLDLKYCVKSDLNLIGLVDSQIIFNNKCTYHNSDSLFSFRKNGTGGGEQAGYIGLLNYE